MSKTLESDYFENFLIIFHLCISQTFPSTDANYQINCTVIYMSFAIITIIYPSTQLIINTLVNTLKGQLVSVVHSTIFSPITKGHRANYPEVNTSIYLYNVC